MNIFHFPNEMLEHIFSFIDTDFELAQLVKTHPVFYQLCNKQLYRINAQNESTTPAIHWAAERGQLATAKKVIEFDLDINQLDSKGMTPLRRAAANGQTDMVELILGTHNVEFSLLQQGDKSPLYAAAAKGSAEIVQMLLDYDRKVRAELQGAAGDRLTLLVDVNTEDSERLTPLWKAMKENHAQVLEILLGLDDINATAPDRREWSPFMHAVWQCSRRIIEVFLESGKIDPNAVSVFGWTPLTKAISKKRSTALQVLFASDKVDVNVRARQADGKTVSPFDMACIQGETQAIWGILRGGLDIKARSDTGRTPLHTAVDASNTRGGKLVAELLSMEGVDVNAKDDRKYTPLHAACNQLASPEPLDPDDCVVGTLLKVPGIDINAMTNDGETPFSLALCFREQVHLDLLLSMPNIELNTPSGAPGTQNTPIVQTILQNHHVAFFAILRHPNFDPVLSLKDRPPFLLHAAATNNDIDMVKFMLNNGADINENDECGKTPLSVEVIGAGRAGSNAVKRFLLTRDDLDPNLTDDSGCNPFLDTAKSSGSSDSADLLSYFLAHSRIDPNMTNGFKPALSLAVSGDSLTKVDLLLSDPRINVNNTEMDSWIGGCTPLHYATDDAKYRCAREKIVERLVAHKDIDVNALNSSKRSPLHLAAREGLYGIVRIILHSGLVDTSKYDQSVWSPLHLAALNGYVKVVEVLLDKGGIDVNHRGTDGKSALALARRHCRWKVVAFLRKRGAR